MINFLHTFSPEPILISFGPITVRYYGLLIAIGILLAISLSLRLAREYKISSNKIFDLAFWVVISGIVGARIYAVFLELNYYLQNPVNVFKVWQGGLAIHGAVLFGVVTVLFFSRKEKINFWILTSIIVPGLALAQALGRFGNYFNQELFGMPTNLPFGIPIDLMNRPVEYISKEFFHPTFLYESLGNLLIFLILFSTHIYLIKNKKTSIKNSFFITIIYLILYSFLRFELEYVRIDKTPLFLGLRFPQVVSLFIIFVCAIFIKYRRKL